MNGPEDHNKPTKQDADHDSPAKQPRVVLSGDDLTIDHDLHSQPTYSLARRACIPFGRVSNNPIAAHVVPQ